MEAAYGVANTKQTFLAARYQWIAARCKKKAVIAVAHAILSNPLLPVDAPEPYQELGANYFYERERQDVIRQVVRRLQCLGYDVVLQPTAQAV
jgi:hypothetical protein